MAKNCSVKLTASRDKYCLKIEKQLMCQINYSTQIYNLDS